MRFPAGFLLVFLVAWALAAQALAAAVPRLAIVNLVKELELEGALMAELSRAGSVELVERTELDALAGEQRLQELAGKRAFHTLGGLLRADGLLLIERLGPEMSIRVVAVRTGACLLYQSLGTAPKAAPKPAPRPDPDEPLHEDEAAPPFSATTLAPADPAAMARTLAHGLSRLAPKLLLEREQAISVALLNLRSAVSTKSLVEFEHTVSRLVELSLAAQPGIIVLERRRLGDVEFERSLEASDLEPLRNSAWLIDGSFEPAESPAGTVKFTLRLRSSQNAGAARQVSVSGSRERPAPLARDLAAAILKAVAPDGNSVVPLPGAIEAQAFVDETFQAVRDGETDLAREALASAIALGGHNVDTLRLSAELTLHSIQPHMQGWSSGSAFPSSEVLRNRHAAFFAALEAFRAYEAVGAEEAMKRLPTPRYVKWPFGGLREDLMQIGSELLDIFIHQGGNLEVKDLRAALRNLAHWNTSGNPRPDEMRLITKRSEVWAETFAEWLLFERTYNYRDGARAYAFFEKLSQEPAALFGKYFPYTPENLAILERTRRELIEKPENHLAALWMRSLRATPENQAVTRRAYLIELEKHIDALSKHGQLDEALSKNGELDYHLAFLGRLGRLGSGNREDAREDARFLRHLFTLEVHVPPLAFLGRFGAASFPKEYAQEVWDAFQNYRARCLAKGIGEDRNFSWMASDFLSRHSDIVMAKRDGALRVTRFWQPYDLPGAGTEKIVLNQVTCQDDTAWIFSYAQGPFPNRPIFGVNLRNWQTEVLTPPTGEQRQQLLVQPEALWVMSYGYPYRGTTFLDRYDREKMQWRSYELPDGYTGSHLVSSHDRLLLSLGGASGILRYDPATGRSEILASSRRVPAQTLYDGRSGWGIFGFLFEPGGQPCMIVTDKSRLKVVRIGEPNGTWPEILDLPWPDRESKSWEFEGCTLLLSPSGEVAFFDPAQTLPERWWIRLPGRTFPPEISGATSPRWVVGKSENPSPRSSLAFRRDEMFALETDRNEGFKLRWFWKNGVPEGLAIPLHFELPAEASQAVAQLPSDSAFQSAETAANPLRGFGGVQVCASKYGIVLHSLYHGFWFIPNQDLETFRDAEKRRF